MQLAPEPSLDELQIVVHDARLLTAAITLAAWRSGHSTACVCSTSRECSAGRTRTRMLCDLGAEVIKVEPPEGDITRTVNPRVNGLATYFVQQNTGKRNISLDTTQAGGGRAAAAPGRLLRRAGRELPARRDGSHGPRLRRGCGAQPAASSMRRSAATAPPGRGHRGAPTRRWSVRRRGSPRSRATCAAASTPTIRSATPTSTPRWRQPSAILAALFNRSRTGRGDRIEVSMAETMLYVNEHAHDQLWDGDVPPEWIRSFESGGVSGVDRGQRRDRGDQRASRRARHVRALHEGDRPSGPHRRSAVRRRADAPRALRRAHRGHSWSGRRRSRRHR